MRNFDKLPTTTRIFGLRDDWPGSMERIVSVGPKEWLPGKWGPTVRLELSALRFVDLYGAEEIDTCLLSSPVTN